MWQKTKPPIMVIRCGLVTPAMAKTTGRHLANSANVIVPGQSIVERGSQEFAGVRTDPLAVCSKDVTSKHQISPKTWGVCTWMRFTEAIYPNESHSDSHR